MTNTIEFQFRNKNGFALIAHGIFLDHGAKINILSGGHDKIVLSRSVIMAPELGQEIQALTLEIDNRQHRMVHEFNEQHHFSIDMCRNLTS